MKIFYFVLFGLWHLMYLCKTVPLTVDHHSKSFNCSNQRTERSCLLVIDVQNCFLPNGTLPLADGDEVIPVINQLRSNHAFDVVIFSKDWHCPNHVSFASQHPGYNEFESVELEYDTAGNLCSAVMTPVEQNCSYGSATRKNEKDSSQLGELIIIGHRLNQTLWPNHCIMETEDSDLNKQLMVEPDDVIVYKGTNCHVDSYSAFFDNGRFSQTDLNQKLRERDISQVYIVGLALDYCVFYSAMDSVESGYETFVIVDATRGIAETSIRSALEQMELSGVKLINSTDVDLNLC